MNVKLTDAQLVMLSAAAQRDDRCLTAPDTMKGAILANVAEKLVKLGLVRELRARVGTSVWRRDDSSQSYALKLTAAGLKAIHGAAVPFNRRAPHAIRSLWRRRRAVS
jgi:hypothetical protein